MAGITTRCKFKCETVNKSPAGGEPYEDITLRANYDPADETNKVWSKYTPSGMFQMSVTNPAVLGHFEVGKSYYLDITEAE